MKARSSHSLDAAAAEWLARRDAGFSAEEEREFLAWCALDSRHAAAVARLERSWSALDRPRLAGAEHEVFSRLSTYAQRRRRWRVGATAAALVVLMTVGVSWWSRPLDAPATTRAIVHSPAQQVLADGTTVELETGAQITVNLSPQGRHVDLRGGGAHFQVAHDPDRPFVVTAGHLEVRAVGTGFLVQLGRDEVEVLVTEGKVAVAAAGPEPSAPTAAAPRTAAGEPPAVFLEAGQRTVLDATAEIGAAPILKVTAPEMAARMSWRARRFEFTGAPLSEAIALLNRYNDVQFELTDAALANEQISGIFRADNVDGFVHMLVSVLPVSVQRSEQRMVVGWRE